MKKFLCEIYNIDTGSHITWFEIEADNLWEATGEARADFSRLYRHTTRFRFVHQDSWNVRAVEI